MKPSLSLTTSLRRPLILKDTKIAGYTAAKTALQCSVQASDQQQLKLLVNGFIPQKFRPVEILPINKISLPTLSVLRSEDARLKYGWQILAGIEMYLQQTNQEEPFSRFNEALRSCFMRGISSNAYEIANPNSTINFTGIIDIPENDWPFIEHVAWHALINNLSVQPFMWAFLSGKINLGDEQYIMLAHILSRMTYDDCIEMVNIIPQHSILIEEMVRIVSTINNYPVSHSIGAFVALKAYGVSSDVLQECAARNLSVLVNVVSEEYWKQLLQRAEIREAIVSEFERTIVINDSTHGYYNLMKACPECFSEEQARRICGAAKRMINDTTIYASYEDAKMLHLVLNTFFDIKDVAAIEACLEMYIIDNAGSELETFEFSFERKLDEDRKLRVKDYPDVRRRLLKFICLYKIKDGDDEERFAKARLIEQLAEPVDLDVIQLFLDNAWMPINELDAEGMLYATIKDKYAQILLNLRNEFKLPYNLSRYEKWKVRRAYVDQRAKLLEPLEGALGFPETGGKLGVVAEVEVNPNK